MIQWLEYAKWFFAALALITPVIGVGAIINAVRIKREREARWIINESKSQKIGAQSKGK